MVPGVRLLSLPGTGPCTGTGKGRAARTQGFGPGRPGFRLAADQGAFLVLDDADRGRPGRRPHGVERGALPPESLRPHVMVYFADRGGLPDGVSRGVLGPASGGVVR